MNWVRDRVVVGGVCKSLELVVGVWLAIVFNCDHWIDEAFVNIEMGESLGELLKITNSMGPTSQVGEPNIKLIIFTNST